MDLEKKTFSEDNSEQEKQMVINNDAISLCNSILSKTKFMAMIGLAGSILIIIAGLIILAAGGGEEVFTGLWSLLCAGLGIYMTTKLLSGIRKSEEAINSTDSDGLTSGLRDINLVVRITWILTWVYLVIICLAILFAIFSGIR